MQQVINILHQLTLLGLPCNQQMQQLTNIGILDTTMIFPVITTMTNTWSPMVIFPAITTNLSPQRTGVVIKHIIIISVDP